MDEELEQLDLQCYVMEALDESQGQGSSRSILLRLWKRRGEGVQRMQPMLPAPSEQCVRR